jgi:hypothetical protein
MCMNAHYIHRYNVSDGEKAQSGGGGGGGGNIKKKKKKSP